MATSIETFAQWVRFEYGVDAGLPDPNIKHILQDRDGYIWLASERGLIKYDGTEFRLYNAETDSVFKTSNITSTLEDSRGRLWIGTWGEGIIIKDNNEFRAFRYGNDELNGFIAAIVEDANGTIWIGTDGGGVYQYADTLRHFGEDEGVKTVHVATMSVTSDSLVVIGGYDNGLDIFDGYSFSNYPLPNIKSRDLVTAVYEDNNGLLWVTTSQGLYTFKEGVFEEIPINLSHLNYPVLRDIEPLDEENYLVTTEEEVLRFHLPTKTFSSFKNLVDRFVPVLYGDIDENIWMVEYGAKLVKYSKRTVTKVPLDIEIDFPSINAITIDDGGVIWLATGNGIFRIENGAIKHFTTTDGLSENIVNGVLALHSEELLITYNQEPPHIYDGYTFRDLYDSNNQKGSYSGVVESSDGTIWLGQNGIGILKFSKGKSTVLTEKNNAPNGRIIDLVEDNDGKIWVATDYGIRKIVGDTLYSFEIKERLQAFVITDLYVDKNGLLWIGAADGRLQVYDGIEFKQFSEETKLTLENIHSIHEDKNGYLWMANKNVIARASYDELLQRLDDGKPIESLLVLDQSDGIPPVTLGGYRSQSSVFNEQKGEIWYTTSNGVIKVNTEEIVTNKRPIETRVNAIRLDNEEVEVRNVLIIPPDKYFIELDYAGLGFTAPEAFRYEYRLSPGQTDWIDASVRKTAYYSNLNPGSYIFEVRTINEDGITGPPNFTEIKVLPTFYETVWFKIIVLIVVGLIFYGLYAYRVAQIRQTEQLRFQIAGDLHDEIGGNLGSIILRTQMLERRETLSERAEKDLKTISSISNETAQAMRDIVWLINPDNDKLDNLALKLRNLSRQLLEGSEIKFITDDKVRDWSFSPGQRKQIILFAKEALNNIRKHANATQISIKVQIVKNRFNLTISDNGRGFDTNSVQSDGMGMSSMQKRAHSLGGETTISSSLGKGTTIQLTV